MNEYVIEIQNDSYYTPNFLSNGRLDYNINNAIIFKSSTKESIKEIGKSLLYNTRCMWRVVEYNEALEEYNNKHFVTINGIKYEYGDYLDVKQAIIDVYEGNDAACIIGNKIKKLEKSIDNISTDMILNGTFRELIRLGDE